ncbi:MAG: hypothetical protein ACUVWX_12005 [Kiritimatiellia bacterium]
MRCWRSDSTTVLSRWVSAIALTFLSALLCPPLLAGLIIDVTVSYPSGGRIHRSEGRILLEGSRMKFAPLSAASSQEFIYVAGDGHNIVIDHATHSYYEFSATAVTGIGKVRSAARSLRTRLRELFGWEEAPENELSIQATPQTAALCALSCRRYVVRRGDTPLQEIWVAAWRDAGLSAKELDTLRDFLHTYESTLPALLRLAGCEVTNDLPLSGLLRVPGYPVFVRYFGDSASTYTVTLSRPRTAAIPAQHFQPPGRYSRRF